MTFQWLIRVTLLPNSARAVRLFVDRIFAIRFRFTLSGRTIGWFGLGGLAGRPIWFVYDPRFAGDSGADQATCCLMQGV